MTVELSDRKIGDLAASLASQRTLRREPVPVPIWDSKQVPSAFVRETDRDIPARVVAWYEGAGEPIRPKLRRALTASERDALTRRRHELRTAMAAPTGGRHGDRCASAVSAMIAGFVATTRVDLESATAVVAAYLRLWPISHPGR
jgi:hypothetical protein